MKEADTTYLTHTIATVLGRICLSLALIAAAILSVLIFCFTIQVSFSSIGTTGYILDTGSLLKPNISLIIGFFSVFLFVALTWLFWHESDRFSKKTLLLVGFIAAAAYMIYIVITSGAEPSRGDAYMCWESGKAALAHNQTYFLETPSTMEVDHNWTPAVYFSIYPFQLGLVTCSEVLHALFGEAGAVYAMRLLNLAAILYTIYVLAVFSESLVKSERVFKLAFFFLISCWPLLNYVSYTYGNWLGLGFVMGALHLQYLAMQAEKKRRYLLLSLSVLPLSCGLMLKATHILFALAFVVVWLVWAIQQRCAWPFLLSVAVLLCANISCVLPVQLVENQVGLDFGEGMPKTSWIEMGINPEGNGMYNTEVSEKYAQEVLGEDSTSTTNTIPSIPDSLAYWATHPGEAFLFFTNKLVTEWTQPDYASTMYYLEINQPDELVNDRAYTNALITVQNTGRDLYGGAQIALSIAATFGFFILLKQKIAAEKLILPACFVTGFLVFLLWEGQTIYVLPFWLCLLPVAAMAVDYVLSHIMEKLDSLE